MPLKPPSFGNIVEKEEITIIIQMKLIHPLQKCFQLCLKDYFFIKIINIMCHFEGHTQLLFQHTTEFENTLAKTWKICLNETIIIELLKTSWQKMNCPL